MQKNINIISLGLIVVLVLFGAGAVTYINQNKEEIQPNRDLPENHTLILSDAIRTNDPSVLEVLPAASEMKAETAEDALKIFSASRTSNVYDFSNRTVEYLVKILDSDVPEFEPYKNIAAYFLLHSFYDSGGDIMFFTNAVNSSNYMKAVTPKAAAIFPKIFEIPLDQLSFPEKSLYFASYLMAMSGDEGTIAMPANASLELSRAYLQMKKYPESRLYKSVSIEEIEKHLQNHLKLSLDRLDVRKKTDFADESGLSHDSVVGLNNTAVAIDSVRAAGFAEAFPVVESVVTEDLFVDSLTLAGVKVPSLMQFSRYLYLRSLALSPEQSDEKSKTIEELVYRLIGTSPYSNINDTSFITYILKSVGTDQSVYSFYTRNDINQIATSSENFRNFLVEKGYYEILLSN